MSLRLAVATFTLGAGVALGARSFTSQDPGAAKPPSKEQQDEMMKGMMKWMEVMNPGQHHKMLDESIGKWDTVTKIWMGGPGTPPTETKGTCERRWVLGNRFVLEEMHGQMSMPDMATGAMKLLPWDGMGLFGYDNYRNMYVGCWADNMGTQLLTMRGAADPAGKVFTYYGEMDEPMLGVIGRTVKYVTRAIDKDNAVFEIFDLHAGDNFKVVEVTYKRKK